MSTIRKATLKDLACIIEIAMDDSVRPSLELPDWNDAVDWDRALRTSHIFMFKGGFILARIVHDDVCEVHICALPEGRGRTAYKASIKAMAALVKLGFKRLIAPVHRCNPGAQMFCAALGFRRYDVDDDHIHYEWWKAG